MPAASENVDMLLAQETEFQFRPGRIRLPDSTMNACTCGIISAQQHKIASTAERFNMNFIFSPDVNIFMPPRVPVICGCYVGVPSDRVPIRKIIDFTQIAKFFPGRRARYVIRPDLIQRAAALGRTVPHLPQNKTRECRD